MLYAVGDIHGQKAELERALALIEADGGADEEVFFLGDFVDRGPDSKGTIQLLMDGQNAGRPWYTVLGNHDVMFHKFVRKGIRHDPMIKSGKSWLHPALGGPATLASYMPDLELDHPEWRGMEAFVRDGMDDGPEDLIQMLQIAAKEQIPLSHTNWIASCALYIEARWNHLFVHAGIRPGVPLSDQVQNDLTWIRDGWLDDTRDHGVMVVHGHTALDYPKHHGNRINLDGGAGYGRPLIPAVFDGDNWHLLTDQGRELLLPSG